MKPTPVEPPVAVADSLVVALPLVFVLAEQACDRTTPPRKTLARLNVVRIVDMVIILEPAWPSTRSEPCHSEAANASVDPGRGT